MATATATKAKGTKIRELSIKAIKRDPDLQSRAAMSMEHAREFSECMLRGDRFPPVQIVEDQKGDLWLWNGWHRLEAAIRAGLRSIRAEITQGTKKDAIVLAAGANKEMSINRTRADIHRALEMLFSQPDWWEKSDRLIAEHVGVSVGTATNRRQVFSAQNGTAIPHCVVTRNGVLSTKPTPREMIIKGESLPVVSSPPSRPGYFVSTFDGKKVQVLAKNQDEAIQKTKAVIASRLAQAESEGAFYKITNIRMLLARRGYKCETVNWKHSRDRISGLRFGGFLAVTIPDCCRDSLLQSVGKLIVLKQFAKHQGDLLLVCNCSKVNPDLVNAIRDGGISVMSTSEMFEAMAQQARAGKTS